MARPRLDVRNQPRTRSDVFSLKTFGFDDIEASLFRQRPGKKNSMLEQIKDWTEYFDVFGEYFVQLVRATYASQGREGHKWKELTENTKASRREAGDVNPANILMRDGALFRSLANRRDPKHHERLGKITAEYGSKITVSSLSGRKYLLWKLHYEGTRPHKITAKRAVNLRFVVAGPKWVSKPSVNHPGNPARKPVVVSERDMIEAVRWAQEYAMTGFVQTGPRDWARRAKAEARRKR
jgi:hypothetical protein